MKQTALADCTAAADIVATIGICKNAGKTTVLNYLVQSIYKNYCTALTSIGYDGEESDFITMLPKPKIAVHPGMFIATSSACLEKTDVKFKIVCETGFATAVGPVSIVKVFTGGTIEVSGPSVASQIDEVSKLCLELGAQKVIVDGAAGRLSHACYADCAILSVGAAVSTDMEKVIRRAKHAVEMLSLKSYSGSLNDLSPGSARSLVRPYIVTESDDGLIFIFRGAMADKDLIAIMKEYRDVSFPKTAVVRDAAAIFISPGLYYKFRKKNGGIKVLKAVNLVALTINPMSPYGQWFDAVEFRNRMQGITSLPVYNIKDEQGGLI